MENVVLYGPGGASPVNVGSWLLADPGPDYGARGLIEAIEAQSFGDGGVLAYERAQIRRMSFPLLPASGGAGLSLTGLESLLRLNARPGGFIDVQPDGVASADAVRFDIIHGRWEPEHSIPINRAARRPGALLLDTQPYGYWPTWITLASSASVAAPGVVALAALPGDAPGFAEITIQPAGAATSFAGGGSNLPDVIGWSLAAKPSFVAFVPPASMVAAIAGSIFTGELVSPASQTLRLFNISAQFGAWTPQMAIDIATAMEPAYRGRYRAFVYAQLLPSQAVPWQMSADVVTPVTPLVGFALPPLASANAIATLPPGFGPAVAAGSAFNLLDLGEVTLPATPSGMTTSARLRVWAKSPTSNPGISTALVGVGGVYLLPLDGPNGVLTAGVQQPTNAGSGIGTSSRLVLNSYDRRVLAALGSGPLDTQSPIGDLTALHRGVLPYIGATTVKLNTFYVHRNHNAAATWPIWRDNDAPVAVSVRGRPRFQFLKGL